MIVNKCGAPKNFKRKTTDGSGCRETLRKNINGGLEVEDVCGHSVYEVTSCKNGITPEQFGSVGCEHGEPSNFQKVLVFSFSNAILLGCFVTRTLMYNSFFVQVSS